MVSHVYVVILRNVNEHPHKATHYIVETYARSHTSTSMPISPTGRSVIARADTLKSCRERPSPLYPPRCLHNHQSESLVSYENEERFQFVMSTYTQPEPDECTQLNN